MSSNYEILRQANRDQELFPELAEPMAVPPPTRTGLNLKEQTHEESIKLVRRIFFSGSIVPQVVIFSGVERGSGCSWVCTRVAETLASHVDSLVCLVDADLRAPSLHRFLKVEGAADLSNDEFLSAPVQQIGRTDRGPNLWLVSGNPAAGTPQAPLGLDRLELRISELRKSFTYILIDAPPINAYADAALLGRMGDGLVMVLEANNTRREAAVRARETLMAGNVRLLGAVLNKRTFPIPEKLYRKL